MSKAQYNITKQTNYLKRTMFLDPAGPVTVQRLEHICKIVLASGKY